jgi:hypothetical protein
MLFFDDLYLLVFDSQFEQRDYVVSHELCRESATYEARKSFSAADVILFSLNDREPIPTSFGLNR